MPGSPRRGAEAGAVIRPSKFAAPKRYWIAGVPGRFSHADGRNRAFRDRWDAYEISEGLRRTGRSEAFPEPCRRKTGVILNHQLWHTACPWC